ncbi:hypothetical protein LAZ67_1007809 [Cordylochernes scorpioides]|uniref:Fibronectin type-III domain-containing protein n=1 Tax=Cordylochernes scorpioides TaxID=51811 RepID=A0ABY6K118_9ARAC|nr:hypothetical protein LAZ67_1007809 [Cordylochernes scorpioides]
MESYIGLLNTTVIDWRMESYIGLLKTTVIDWRMESYIGLLNTAVIDWRMESYIGLLNTTVIDWRMESYIGLLNTTVIDWRMESYIGLLNTTVIDWRMESYIGLLNTTVIDWRMESYIGLLNTAVIDWRMESYIGLLNATVIDWRMESYIGLLNTTVIDWRMESYIGLLNTTVIDWRMESYIGLLNTAVIDWRMESYIGLLNTAVIDWRMESYIGLLNTTVIDWRMESYIGLLNTTVIDWRMESYIGLLNTTVIDWRMESYIGLLNTAVIDWRMESYIGLLNTAVIDWRMESYIGLLNTAVIDWRMESYIGLLNTAVIDWRMESYIGLLNTTVIDWRMESYIGLLNTTVIDWRMESYIGLLNDMINRQYIQNTKIGCFLKFDIYQSITDRGTTSDLHIQGTNRHDNGLYSCVAKNAHGKDERTIKLLVLEVPSPPSDVKVDKSWSRSVDLRWNKPYSGNSNILKFIVQYWRDSVAPHKLEEVEVLPPQSTTILHHLHPGTSYMVRVLAENEVGRGNPSDSQQFFTKEAEPNAPPTDVWVEARGAGSLLVKFKAPPRDQWNGQLKAYHIGYKIHGSDEPYSYKTVEFSKDLEEEHKLTKLQKSTDYSIIVKASNSAGMGPESQEIIRKTSDTDPPAAPYLWVESQGSTSLKLRWDQKVREKEQITRKNTHFKHCQGHHHITTCRADFTLFYQEDGGTWTDLTIPLNAESQYLLTGLREGTRYRLYMKAVSPAGQSDPSGAILVKTEGGPQADVPHAGAGYGGLPPDPEHEVPVYLRMSVLVPVAASVALVMVVVVGACLYVRREERRYRSALAVKARGPISWKTSNSTLGLLIGLWKNKELLLDSVLEVCLDQS